jgi:hypothetical protein
MSVEALDANNRAGCLCSAKRSVVRYQLVITLCKVALKASKCGTPLGGALMLSIWKILLQLRGLSAPASTKKDNEAPKLWTVRDGLGRGEVVLCKLTRTKRVRSDT